MHDYPTVESIIESIVQSIVQSTVQSRVQSPGFVPTRVHLDIEVDHSNSSVHLNIEVDHSNSSVHLNIQVHHSNDCIYIWIVKLTIQMRQLLTSMMDHPNVISVSKSERKV